MVTYVINCESWKGGVQVVIFTDSGADLPRDYLNANGIASLPLSVIMNGKEYKSVEEAAWTASKVSTVTCARVEQRAPRRSTNTLLRGVPSRACLRPDLIYLGLSRG
jgi:hypothetical protein